MQSRPLGARKFAVWIVILVLGLAVAVSAVVWSGVYNVAASRGHFPITAWILEVAMRQSVKAHSWFIQSPPLDDPDMVRLGAGHYQAGCAPCHGAPGKPRNLIVQRMLPPPSHLPRIVKSWPPEQLFWIVKNGLKYTAMPAWMAPSRDDEVWAIVAFLRQLPTITAKDYRSLAIGNADRGNRTAREIAHFGSDAAALSACARCHDDETSPPRSRLVPKLAGQSAQYLETALTNYADGLRHSGIMQPVAGELDKETVKRLSSYYASLPVRMQHQLPAASPERIERGRIIATAGVPGRGIPPCLICHGGTGSPTYPKLAGQHRKYIIGQLRLFQNRLRNETPQSVIMTTIAQRLTAEQIEDVAQFLERLEPGTGAASTGASP
jgi:cytochrome c553